MGSPARAILQPKQVQDVVFGVPQPGCDFSRLKRPVAGTKVAIQQLRDFFRCARLLDLVHGSKEVLVQATIIICYVTQLQRSGLNVDLLEGAHLRLLYKFEVGRSRRTGWHELENQLRIASGWCSPAAPVRVYDRSNPFGPRTFISQFSLAREPEIDTRHFPRLSLSACSTLAIISVAS
jgi:hypothetical protein